MTFPDQPAPTPIMPPYFGGGEVGGFWPQILMNNELSEPHSHFEYAPPSKRQRNSENSLSNSASFSPMNPRMNPQNLPVNKGTTHIFFKTRMCVKFMEGNCRNGDNCTFAHGPEDLRQPPPNWQELVAGREKDRGAGDWNDDQRIIHRMKICKKFYNGEECPYGDKCNFLHEVPSKFKNDMPIPREVSVISIGTMGPGPMAGNKNGPDQPETFKQANGGADSFRANMKPVYWKTRLCSKWETTGQCPFGERCHFAHGLSELQMPVNRTDADMMNAVPVPAKPNSAPANNAFPPAAVAIAPIIEEGDDKKCLSKWKGTKKINRIYGDWIDDLAPPRNLPSTVET